MLDRVQTGPNLKGHFIAGEWVAAPATFADYSPSNGHVWAQAPDGDVRQMGQAIAAAHEAFGPWRALSFAERSHHLLKMAEFWEQRLPDFVAAIQGEAGGWIGKGQFEGGYVPEVFRAAAALAYAPIGEILPSETHKMSTAMRVPLGVVGVVSPWNFPGLLTARGFAFALAAGNTIVLKPSEETPYTGGLYFAEIAEAAGLPPGVLNVVTCSRDHVAAVGDELIDHPLIKGISFTGSTPVGRRIAAKCGAHLKKCCVELGGKDSLIVLDDADMARATQAANFGAFMHQGQICMSVEKILVQERVYEAFLQGFVARAAKLKVGPTTDPANVIGPLINARQVARVKAQLEDAVQKGAQIAHGGKIDGLFVEPTILTQVRTDMDIWRQETFGPLVVVAPFKTDQEAIAMNNDTEFGLSAGIMSQNEDRAIQMMRQLQTGMCHINCSSVNDEPHVPFGGSKASGVGRHGGRWSMETFTETRWITLDRGGRAYPPVF